MREDLCLVCQRPTRWHFVEGRAISCAEVTIQLGGKIPKYATCRAAMAAWSRLPKRLKER